MATYRMEIRAGFEPAFKEFAVPSVRPLRHPTQITGTRTRTRTIELEERCASFTLFPRNGKRDRSRTCNLRFWRPLLCHLSYPPIKWTIQESNLATFPLEGYNLRRRLGCYCPKWWEREVLPLNLRGFNPPCIYLHHIPENGLSGHRTHIFPVMSRVLFPIQP